MSRGIGADQRSSNRSIRFRVRVVVMRISYLAVACLPILGQTSAVSSVTKSPGEKVTLEI